MDTAVINEKRKKESNIIGNNGGGGGRQANLSTLLQTGYVMMVWGGVLEAN